MASEQELQDLHDKALSEFDDIWSVMEHERKQCLEDREFYSIPSRQWAGALGAQFENKPRFEVNKTHLAVMRVINEYRNNPVQTDFVSRSTVKADKLSDTCDALLRADEQESCADEAKLNAFEEAVGGGFGAYRLRADYEDEDDPEDERQRIVFEPINDADVSVFFDLQSKRQDKSDAKYCFVLVPYTHDAYKEEFGDDPVSWPADMQSKWGAFEWVTVDAVYVAEYYKVIEKKQFAYVYRGLDGEEVTYTTQDFKDDEELADRLAATGFQELRKKKLSFKEVRKYLLSGAKVLEDCGRIAGKNIPIVPVFGKRWVVNGIERCQGVVRNAKDPQRLANMQRSKLAEIAATSSVEKPIFMAEQMLGHKEIWANDSVQDYPYLTINSVKDASGNPIQSGPVAYTKSPVVPPAMAALLQITEQDLNDVLGNQQAGEQIVSNISGKAVEMIQTRLDMQSFIYVSNMARAEKRAAEIWLGMAKELYSEKGRMMRGYDKSGSMKQIEVAKPIMVDGVQVLDNDLANADMQIVATVGPSSSTKRQATIRDLVNVMQVTSDPEAQAVMQSLILMNMEGDGVSDVNDWARQRLVKMGAIKPTEEEAKAMQEAQANAKPDANQAYLDAAAQEAAAKAGKAAADTDLAKAKTLETLSNIEGNQQAQALELLDRIQPQQAAEVVAVNPPAMI